MAPNFTKFLMHVEYGRVSVFPWPRCDMLYMCFRFCGWRHVFTQLFSLKHNVSSYTRPEAQFMCVCLHSKRKPIWAIITKKLCKHTSRQLIGMHWPWRQRSKVKVMRFFLSNAVPAWVSCRYDCLGFSFNLQLQWPSV